MTVSFVGAASAEATSLTLPTHQAGDLIVICAARTPNGAITMPTGWKTLLRRDAQALTTLAAWKIANTSGELSGTWTGANLLQAAVYRHTTESIVPNGNSVNASAASTTVTFLAITNETANAGEMTSNNWVAAFALSASNAIDFETPPTGMTNRAVISGATALELALHDTNANVTSWASTNRTANASAAYHTIVFSIEPTGYAKTASAGMLVHPGMSGGMRG